MITRLDAHDGPLPGLYVCDGNVSRSPAAALQEAANGLVEADLRLQGYEIELTPRARARMTREDRARLDEIVQILGVKLVIAEVAA